VPGADTLLSLLQVCVRTELGPTVLRGNIAVRRRAAAVSQRHAAVAMGFSPSARALVAAQ